MNEYLLSLTKAQLAALAAWRETHPAGNAVSVAEAVSYDKPRPGFWMRTLTADGQRRETEWQNVQSARRAYLARYGSPDGPVRTYWQNDPRTLSYA